MLYIIKSDTTEVELNTTGGELHSLQHNGIEYLWQGDTSYWGGRAPVCFPICGAIRNGEATAFGKRCKMPRHGVARRQEFEVISSSVDSVTFRLVANADTILQYPFHFELQIQYLLKHNTVDIGYTVINHGGCKMPFTIGAHPAFNCPLESGEEFKDYFIQFACKENASCMRPDLQTGLLDPAVREACLEDTAQMDLFHFLFTKDAMVFDDLQSKRVTLRSKKTGRGIQVDFADFNNLLFWSSIGNTPFLAIEPWTGLATCRDEDDHLEHKRGMTVLESGASATFRYQITLL